MSDKKSQLQFEMSEVGDRCFVYYEDTCTKSNDRALKNMKVDRKVVWVHPNKIDVRRCPVRIVEKYLSLCPEYTKKANFYLQSLQKPMPKQWYGVQVVGLNLI